ncbi:MAG: hypothetical protein KGL39_13355 [Patescibacteria group bacterium]|nr:hypothetical protein [Patescibacteria group bacterium]
MSQRQIIYFPAGAQAQPIELGDDALGHRISVGLPVQQRLGEDVAMADADWQLQLNHGNRVNVFTWTVDRDHGTVDAAVAFMRDHADSIPSDIGPATAVLQEAEDGGDAGASGSVIRFLQQCRFISIECVRWDGQSTVYRYTVHGAAWTDTQNAVS